MMQMLARRCAMLALGLVAMAGCGGDSGPTGNTQKDNVLSASIEGAQFQATSVSATRTNVRVFLVATSGTNTITLSVLTPGTPSTITVEGGDQNSLVYNQGGVAGSPAWGSGSVNGGTGSVTFTTISATEATGTFNFSGLALTGTPATGSRAITNGTFSVKF